MRIITRDIFRGMRDSEWFVEIQTPETAHSEAGPVLRMAVSRRAVERLLDETGTGWLVASLNEEIDIGAHVLHGADCAPHERDKLAGYTIRTFG